MIRKTDIMRQKESRLARVLVCSCELCCASALTFALFSESATVCVGFFFLLPF